jgi:integrase
MATGIRQRGGSWEAFVYDRRTKKKIRKTFTGQGAFAAAKLWRADAVGAVRRGTMRPPDQTTLREAWERWYAGALEGTIRNRSGERYKPSALRSYEAAMRTRVLFELGGLRLSNITRRDVRDFVNRLLADELDPSTVRNTIMPLRVVFREALANELVVLNPCAGVKLPAVTGRRTRIASPGEAVELISALPEPDQCLWACAFYSGLRRGELMALRWEDIDLPAGLIRVVRAWDPKERAYVTPKSKAGMRRVPIPNVLRAYLLEHRLRSGRVAGLVFGADAEKPFDYFQALKLAKRSWRAAGLQSIGMHEARHVFASLMIAAGVNAKTLSTFMGHASITMTLDRYGHLMPGSEDEAAAMLDSYLERATGASTGASRG